MGRSVESLFVRSGADFSACRTWRVRLWRTWDEQKKPALFIMLNPSTADEGKNDNTVERCQGYASAWGYGGLLVCNLFAYCSTDRRVLAAVPDPVGPNNDAAILSSATTAGLVVCAWGTDGTLKGRDQEVLAMLRRHQIPLSCLQLTRRGVPGHPLYLSKALRPRPFTPRLKESA